MEPISHLGVRYAVWLLVQLNLSDTTPILYDILCYKAPLDETLVLG